MTATISPRIAVGPDAPAFAVEAVRAAGGCVVAPGEDADGIVWLDAADPDGLAKVLDQTPAIRWIQLPWAGVEAFAASGLLHDGRIWTCAKGCFAEPVAEHALALALAGLRHFPERLRAKSWGRAAGTSLFDARVTILGGGGIAEALLRLLQPFRIEATVVRRDPGLGPLALAASTVGPESLPDALPGRLVVFVTLSSTPATRGIIDRAALARMDSTAWLVNVARGAHVVTDDLVAALRDGTIAGAALDVTDPEPLPDGHPLWEQPNAIITPHSADWSEVVRPLLARRIERNVRAFANSSRARGSFDNGAALEGRVDPDLGY